MTMRTIPQLKDETFQAKVLDRRGRPVAILFTKPGCTACVSARAAVRDFADAYTGRVDVFTVDITMNPQLRVTYPSQGVPLVVVFHNGLEVWRRVGGSVKAGMISTWVDDLLSA
ncbi:co-chaperone YbbN [Streptomyces sp. 5-10]|uniref:thioredoxin family protein n=1 Tax=Streptomyces sp. 5-10 TaxID=878925 RepID=UPI00168A58FF|nr:thioredoxin family protein [Streptomyces sp. 5-10]MBD3004724.1 thioredoxin family protein [Streptomyces sp. 5-10]